MLTTSSFPKESKKMGKLKRGIKKHGQKTTLAMKTPPLFLFLQLQLKKGRKEKT
jgi:hypothetical protein